MKKRSNIAPIAIFFATMLVIHFLSSLIFNLFPFPIKPTIVHIPVIIASIIYGPRVGVTLGFLMGLLSLTVNTITILQQATSSHHSSQTGTSTQLSLLSSHVF